MDDIARPPVRIQANASTHLSLKAAQSHVHEFLTDFQTRSIPSKGGDTTITAQLDKLCKSLKEQRARERQNRGTHRNRLARTQGEEVTHWVKRQYSNRSGSTLAISS